MLTLVGDTRVKVWLQLLQQLRCALYDSSVRYYYMLIHGTVS